MFLKQAKYKNGRVFLSIVEGFRENGKVKQRVIQKIGFLDEFTDLYDDPISHFKSVASQMTDDYQKNAYHSITIDLNDLIETGHNLFNFGYLPLKYIYNQTGIPDLLKCKNSQFNATYSFNKIFLLLVISRILYPASKKETFENRKTFFEPFHHFSLDDIYRSLDYFAQFKEDIERCIWENTRSFYNRDTSHSFYDCTNYYFDIAFNDEDLIDEEGNIIEKGYRKRGPEKNKRPDPIVEMGLLMDGSGIPLSYDLFPGNESEKTSLRPILKRTKAHYGIERTIVVADRGLNTSDNIYFLAGKNDDKSKNMDGYVYGQSVRGADKEFKSWVLNHKDYISEIIKEDGREVAFIHKSRKHAKTITIKKDNKRTVKVTVYQKQMAYYSAKYARKQKKEREIMVAKALDLIKKPGKYTKATSYGAANYVKNLAFDKETGEVKTAELLLDIDKIKEEEKYDGYYSIVTSEDHLSDQEIRKIYRGLIKIEDTFKVTKTNLEARPVYVWTKEHIEAHFLTCFVALVITRLLEKRLGNKYSISQIIESLKKYNCINIDKNIYQFLYSDEIIKDIEKEFSIDLSRKYKKREEIRKILKY